MHSVTPLRAGQPEDPIIQPVPLTQLQPVAWLAGVLGMTETRTYYQIREGHVPADCFVRIGRTIRINPQKVYEWLGITAEPMANNETRTTADTAERKNA